MPHAIPQTHSVFYPHRFPFGLGAKKDRGTGFSVMAVFLNRLETLATQAKENFASVTSTGAPNENIVQNHLNIALLNVFWYLNGGYRHIFIPYKFFFCSDFLAESLVIRKS